MGNGLAARLRGAYRLSNRPSALLHGALLALLLYWLSYQAVVFNYLGFEPSASAGLNSWSLIAALALHLAFCHWLAQCLSPLGAQLLRQLKNRR
jgi:hypothetical protein